MMKAIGDNLAFVLPAYIFVFVIWSVASSYDYLSDKWQTVASARRRGVRHLFALILPMMYMGVYIKFQSDAEDAKEMSGGILALLCACVEHSGWAVVTSCVQTLGRRVDPKDLRHFLRNLAISRVFR